MKYNFESLYEHVGYLFYGMVSREGRISATDLLRLTEFVDKNWKPSASSDPGLSVHLADCILRGVRYASINGMKGPHALERFREYFVMHALGFSGTLREWILASVHAIRKEFQGNAESEGVEDILQRLFAIPPVSA